jgi:hypothetical protein
VGKLLVQDDDVLAGALDAGPRAVSLRHDDRHRPNLARVIQALSLQREVGPDRDQQHPRPPPLIEDQRPDVGGRPERAGGLRSQPRLGVGELDRIEQPAPPASVLRPLPGRRFELASALLLRALGLDPVRQRRPGGAHDLVREVDTRISSTVVIVRREQASIDQSLEDELEVGGVAIVHPQLRARLLSPGVRAALAEADQPEQDPAGDRLLRRRQVAKERIGAARERDGEPAPVAISQRLVVGHREALASPPVPELDQRLLQERQDPRLGSRVGEQMPDQLGLDSDPEVARRTHDRLGQRLAAQGGHLDARDPTRTIRPQRALHEGAEEVGAQREDDHAARYGPQRRERAQEPRSLPSVRLRE